MELFDIPTLIIQSINLAIIIFVLYRFAFRPYLAVLEAEEAKRKKLEKDVAASTHIVDDAKVEAKQILDTARSDANQVAADIVDSARKDADALHADAAREAEAAKQKGFADIEHERRALESEMQQRVLDVAIRLNEKMFGKNEANAEFIRQSQKNVTL